MCRNTLVCFVVVKHNGLNTSMLYFWTIDVTQSFTCGLIAWNVRGQLLWDRALN